MDHEVIDGLLADQIDYYRARAGEYDQWFLRQGRYDRGPEANRHWFHEVDVVRQALDAFKPTGQVLELAGGTGWWTQPLMRHAGEVTVVDSSPETLALNRDRVGTDRARFIQADLFAWRPNRRFDVVFFSFWLSHVPPERFDAFWALVRDSLQPGGSVFFVDSRYAESSTAIDHRLEGPSALTVSRRLNDGREYRIVKRFYEPEELQSRLADMGWRIAVQSTEKYFLYGAGGR